MQKTPDEETVQKTINALQREIKDAYLEDDFEAMKGLNGRLFKLASELTNPKHIQAVSAYHQKVSQILKQRQLYASMMTQISEIFRPQQSEMRKMDEPSLKFQLLEQEFQNAFIDRDYPRCLDKLPEILALAIKKKDQGKVTTYLQVKEYLERALPPQKEVTAPVQKEAIHEPVHPLPKEILSKIEDLKKKAIELEGNLEFQQAKAIYQEILKIATEIKDNLTLSLCDQMITQIDIWLEEIEKSEFSVFEIPPFRLMNRVRYDCLEAMGDKDPAMKKMKNLISLGVKPENIKVITITRSKFKGKSPYNKNGECFAIYIRRSLE